MKFCPTCKLPRFSFEMDVMPAKINQLNSLRASSYYGHDYNSIEELKKLFATVECTACIPNYVPSRSITENWLKEVRQTQEQALIKRKAINTQFYQLVQEDMGCQSR